MKEPWSPRGTVAWSSLHAVYWFADTLRRIFFERELQAGGGPERFFRCEFSKTRSQQSLDKAEE